MDKRIIDKVNIVLEIEPIAMMYHSLRGASAQDKNKELETIADTLTLVNIVIRFVENEEMRELEHRFDEMYNNDDTLVKDLLKLVVEILDTVIHLNKQYNLILWQPGKGASLVNGI